MPQSGQSGGQGVTIEAVITSHTSFPWTNRGVGHLASAAKPPSAEAQTPRRTPPAKTETVPGDEDRLAKWVENANQNKPSTYIENLDHLASAASHRRRSFGACSVIKRSGAFVRIL